MRRRFLRIRAAAMFALLAALTTKSHAQTPTWVALDTQPAGTPATVVFMAALSSQSTSVFDVSIHGFYVTQKAGPGASVFQSIEVPGLPNLRQTGAPNLPVCRFDLGLVNGADFAALQPPVVNASQTLAGYNVWPEPIEAMLHDGDDEIFQQDPVIYGTPGPWPPSNGASSPPHELLGFLPTASCETYPFHWDPITGALTIAHSVRYTFVHGPGGGAPLPLTTPANSKVASNLLANWPVVGPAVAVDNTQYGGYYLIVTPQAYQPTLQPLADQKSARGLKVAWRFVEDVGAVCSNIRSAIGTWYNATPKGAEHYCLLVGDVADIPICNGPPNSGDPFGVPSDDPYGNPFAMNNDRPVMVGRLSPFNLSDLNLTVQMILDYEDHPVMDDHYENVLLVAHGGTFGNNISIPPFQEKVRTASYASPPSFYTYYGNVLGNNNVGLKSAIENSPHWGIVDYFGHGSFTSWSGWDVTNENFDNIQVGAMSLAPRNPIVWSTACQSGGIQVEDSFGESWMHRFGLGAVAFYGSSVNARAWPSIDLHQFLFHAVYTQDIRIQSHAYYDAEYRMANYWPNVDDSWKYLMLGDPEMTIRTTQPPSPWVVSAPWLTQTSCGPGGGMCPVFNVRVTLTSGLPAPGVRVGLYQPAGSAADLPIENNRYTDENGIASITATGLDDGYVYFTAMDAQGNTVPDTVWAEGGGLLDVAGPRAGGAISLRATPTVVRDATTFALGRPAAFAARLDLYDATGRRVRGLTVATGADRVRWDGDDASGRRAHSGIYLASFRDSEGRASARVAVLR